MRDIPQSLLDLVGGLPDVVGGTLDVERRLPGVLGEIRGDLDVFHDGCVGLPVILAARCGVEQGLPTKRVWRSGACL